MDTQNLKDMTPDELSRFMREEWAPGHSRRRIVVDPNQQPSLHANWRAMCLDWMEQNPSDWPDESRTIQFADDKGNIFGMNRQPKAGRSFWDRIEDPYLDTYFETTIFDSE